MSELFSIEICKNPISKDFALENPGSTPYITTTSENNGIECFVNYPAQYEGGLITVSKDGGNGDAFLQELPFCGNEKVMVLIPKRQLSQMQLFYYVTVIRYNKVMFGYGRKCSVARLGELHIPNPEEIPKFVLDYKIDLITTKNKQGVAPSLNVMEWKEFSLNKLFALKGGFYNKKPEHSIKGQIPFLASTENNNGVTEYYSIEDICQWGRVGNEDYTLGKKIYDGNCIVVTVDGSVCNAFYQKDDFTCSHSVTALYPIKHILNVEQALFICTVIMMDKYRWNYGRKPHDVSKFGKSTFKLPIQTNEDGKPIFDKNKTYSDEGYVPDWQFMEDYIKLMPYGDRL